MKIAIVGTGGVGGYFGGKLARAGFDVTFIARGEHLTAIREKGLIVKSINGDFLVNPAHATDNIQDIGNADFIILGVKAWLVPSIARKLSNVVHSDAIVMPLQNGILAAKELSAEMGPHHVIGGLCRIFSRIVAPGVIAHLGIEPTILLGELNNMKSERAMRIHEIFEKAGIRSIIAEDIHAELWKKFINICGSGLLALTRSSYGEVRELKETRDLMIELFEEIYELSRKMGIQIDHEFVGKTVSFIDSYPYDSTSSLTRDVWEGKPSEIEYQNGTVVRMGQEYGVKTPVNRFVYNCIIPMEKRARKLFAEHGRIDE